MKAWTIGALATIFLVVLLGVSSWGAYDSGVKELCHSLGWQDGGAGFSGPAYCTEESPDGNQTHRCVWTDAAGGECSPRWPVEDDG